MTVYVLNENGDPLAAMAYLFQSGIELGQAGISTAGSDISTIDVWPLITDVQIIAHDNKTYHDLHVPKSQFVDGDNYIYLEKRKPVGLLIGIAAVLGYILLK